MQQLKCATMFGDLEGADYIDSCCQTICSPITQSKLKMVCVSKRKTKHISIIKRGSLTLETQRQKHHTGLACQAFHMYTRQLCTISRECCELLLIVLCRLLVLYTCAAFSCLLVCFMSHPYEIEMQTGQERKRNTTTTNAHTR